MKLFVLAVALVVAAAPAVSASSESDEVSLMQWGTEGVQLEFYASRASLRAQPRWLPASEAPPVDLLQAISIAFKEGARVQGSGARLELQGVTLQKVLLGEQEDFWFYVVQLESYSGTSRHPGAFAAIVLMDGTLASSRQVNR